MYRVRPRSRKTSGGLRAPVERGRRSPMRRATGNKRTDVTSMNAQNRSEPARAMGAITGKGVSVSPAHGLSWWSASVTISPAVAVLFPLFFSQSPPRHVSHFAGFPGRRTRCERCGNGGDCCVPRSYRVDRPFSGTAGISITSLPSKTTIPLARA